ncbi:hypothetical protein BVX98_01960 [bacterium F11]|nr:hypothetical protein BVX98_01960 [bacterium F11]
MIKNLQKQPFLILLSVLFFLSPLLLFSKNRVQVDYLNEYSGPHQDDFNELQWEIPNLVRQTTIDMSIKIGLPYNEGWQYPMTVKYTDKAGAGAESLLAYVILYQTNKGDFFQELHINLAAYAKQKFDYEKTLSHELIHAMMNDAVGGEAARLLPVWLHEGLAVYGSGEGEGMLRSYVHRFYGFAEQKLLNGLTGPHGALDYVEDYLAVKYIVEAHGPNALPFFIRQLIEKDGKVEAAYEYSTGESWDDFITQSRKYAEDTIKEIKPPRRGRGEDPY